MNIDIQVVVDIAKKAGAAILPFYKQAVDIQHKADQSPVTAADLAANDVIVDGLKRHYPAIPVLSEESGEIDFATRQQWTQYWLVDPLDGTKEFIHHRDEFTVNIALIENNRPILGVVYAPVLQDCYYGSVNAGAFLQQGDADAIKIQTTAADNCLRIMASKRHGREKLETFLQTLPDYALCQIGSSLKMCVIAAGEADIYPRFGPTSEWDTAAAHSILRAAGGEIYALNGEALQYNTKAELRNPEFVAIGDLAFPWQEKLVNT